MNNEEAFKVLGLDLSANSDQVEEKFKHLASHAHPDRGGKEEDMIALNIARSKAHEYISAKYSVIPISSLNQVILATQGKVIEHQQLSAKVTEAKNDVRARSTNKLRKLRRVAAVLAAISTAVTLFGKDLPKTLIPSEPPTSFKAGIDRRIEAEQEANKKAQAELKRAIETKNKITEQFAVEGQPKITEQLVTEPQPKITEQLVTEPQPKIAEQPADEALYAVPEPDYQKEWEAEIEQTNRMFSLFSIFITLLCGGGAGYLTTRIDKIEHELKDFEELTGTKSLMHKFIANIIELRQGNSWTFEILADGIEAWAYGGRNTSYRQRRYQIRLVEHLFLNLANDYSDAINLNHLPRAIGIHSFTKYVLDRSLEMGLIEIKESFEHGELVETYSIKPLTSSIV